jgi:hypothetical protein
MQESVAVVSALYVAHFLGRMARLLQVNPVGLEPGHESGASHKRAAGQALALELSGNGKFSLDVTLCHPIAALARLRTWRPQLLGKFDVALGLGDHLLDVGDEVGVALGGMRVTQANEVRQL